MSGVHCCVSQRVEVSIGSLQVHGLERHSRDGSGYPDIGEWMIAPIGRGGQAESRETLSSDSRSRRSCRTKACPGRPTGHARGPVVDEGGELAARRMRSRRNLVRGPDGG